MSSVAYMANGRHTLSIATCANEGKPSGGTETMYERVLVALDGGPHAELMLKHGVAHAEAFGSQLVLLRVVPSSINTPVGPAGDPIGASASVPDFSAATSTVSAEAEARRYLEDLARQLRDRGCDAVTSVRVGAVAPNILQEATERDISLIALTTEGRVGIVRLVLGSVADEVVRDAHCAVLLIRADPTVLDTSDRGDGRGGHVRNFRDDAEAFGPLAPKPLGYRAVAVERITGSVGRAHELGPDFLPLDKKRKLDDRHRSIQKAMDHGTIMPPIDLYKLGYDYYVLDGNHRLAAALKRGQVDIDAIVTEFVPVDNEEQQMVFAERRAFERATGLTRVGARRPGHYTRLEQLVRAYEPEARAAGLSPADDLKEVARSWYSNVFYPAAQRLRAARLNDVFPGDRTADIFVHLANFHEHESQREGRQLDRDEATQRFLASYGRSRLNVLEHIPGLRRLLRGNRPVMS